MAKHESTTLAVQPREPEGSRATRRMRREGLVPGVIYGGDGDCVTFAVDQRILRNTLAHAGAVLEVSVGDAGSTPVIVKDIQRHPVRGEYVHIDLLRVNMNVAIHTTVTLELLGGEEAPGVKEGGVLTQDLRELNVEALPGDIPEFIQHDVSGMEMNSTLHVSDLAPPEGVSILDDPEIVAASVTPPSAEPVEEELEVETELVGEDGEAADGQAQGDTQDEAEQSAGDSGSDSE